MRNTPISTPCNSDLVKHLYLPNGIVLTRHLFGPSTGSKAPANRLAAVFTNAAHKIPFQRHSNVCIDTQVIERPDVSRSVPRPALGPPYHAGFGNNPVPLPH